MLTKLKHWITGIVLLVGIIVGLFFPPLIGVIAYPAVILIFIVWVLDWMGY